MCGRLVLASPVDRLAAEFGAAADPEAVEAYQPSFNVAPTDEVLGLSADGVGRRRLQPFRWGLVPSGARELSIGSRLFNARAESVATRPAFRSAFRDGRRLVIVADGFFEWRRRANGGSQPFFFRRRDQMPLAFAGLWERWDGGGGHGGRWLRSCTIITTSANTDLAAFHDRMPVILEPSSLDLWLDASRPADATLRGLLGPGRAGLLVNHAVTPLVGDVRNDDPSLIDVYAPAEPAALQPSLFDTGPAPG